MIIVGVGLLSTSITFALMENENDAVTFKITDGDDSYHLNLDELSNSVLYPGISLETPFNIINDTDKNAQLVKVSLNDFKLKDLSNDTYIDSTSSRYNQFVGDVSLCLTHDGMPILEAPLSSILKTGYYELTRDILFKEGAGSRFLIEVAMADTSPNSTQNLKTDFSINFSFEDFTISPPITPPTPTPPVVNPPVPDPPVEEPPTDGPLPENEDSKPVIDNTDTTEPTDTLDDDSATDIPDTKDNPSADDHDITDPGQEPPILIESNLIQTGTFFDSGILAILALILIGSGCILLLRKNR